MNPNENGIGWCDYTLNLAVGCDNGCWYCYARAQAARSRKRCKECGSFRPHLHMERLKHLMPNQAPARVFMDSMSDWGCEGIIEHVPEMVAAAQAKAPQHVYLLLTKCPERFVDAGIALPANWWLGISFTGFEADREAELDRLSHIARYHGAHHTWASYEPALGLYPFEPWPSCHWLVIGALTGRTLAARAHRIGAEPHRIGEKLAWHFEDHGVTVYVKRNYPWANPANRPMNWPPEMLKQLYCGGD